MFQLPLAEPLTVSLDTGFVQMYACVNGKILISYMEFYVSKYA